MILVATLWASQGCAIYYFEKDGTGVVWGVGRLEVRVTEPVGEQQAVARRMTLVGLAAGYDDGALGFSIGFDRRERVAIVDPDSQIGLRREDGSLFRVDLFRPSTFFVEEVGRMESTEMGHVLKEIQE